MTRADQLTDPLAYHAEGPVWSDTWGGLRWVDMLAGDLLTLRAVGTVELLHVGEVAAFFRHRTGGGYVDVVELGLAPGGGPDEAPSPRGESYSPPLVPKNEG